MRIELKVLGITIVSALVLTGCLPGFSSLHSCTERIGRCFDVSVDGQKVAPLTSSSELDRFKRGATPARRVDLDATRWMLSEPVSQTPLPQAAVNQHGSSWFGANPQLEMLVEPLEGQQVRINRSIAGAPSVTMNDRRVPVIQNVVADKKLPPGAYLFTFTLRGSANWDRKHVFATVK